MLSPQEIEKLTDGLAEIWSEFITESLMDIAERIKKNGKLTATAQWRLIKLKELGLQDSYLQKRLASTLKVSKNEMKEMLTSAVIEAIRDDEEILKQAHQAGILNDYRVRAGVVNPIIEKGYNYLNKQTRNFTQSYAGKLNQIYEYALDMAYSRVQSGLMSQQEAVKWTIEDLAKKGIGFITSPSGRTEQLETVIARAVRTTVSKTILDAQMANLEELGCDLVETSSHIDSRPSHAEWQGQIFSLSGKHKKYKPFKESTGFGSIEGLGGINCRHSFYPYFEGLSSKSHKHYKLEHTKEAYEERQKEMRAKNMARKCKREAKILRAGGLQPNVDLTFRYNKLFEWLRNKELSIDFGDVDPEMKEAQIKATKIISKQFKGYVSPKIRKASEEDGGSQYKMQIIPIGGENIFKLNEAIYLMKHPSKGHTDIGSESLAVALHENYHAVIAQLMLKELNINIKLPITGKQLEEMGSWRIRFSKEIYEEMFADDFFDTADKIFDYIEKNISERARFNSDELISESLVALQLEKVPFLSKKLYTYLKERWKRSWKK